MSVHLKKEINKLVVEALKELGHVDHRVQGAKPQHTGFPELPLSSKANEVLLAKVNESYELIEKALDGLDEVVSEMESLGQYPGNLVLIADQVELAADSLAEHLSVDSPEIAVGEKEENLDEHRRKKRKKCRCFDGTKRTRCCRKRRRQPRHAYWFGYGWPFRKFYGGFGHHHHHHDPPPPPPPEEPPPPSDGGGEPPST